MNDKIYYKVKGTLYRSKGKETNLIEIDETFEDENPIIAREKAFGLYQSYIDVLLQSKKKDYVSHKEMVVELKDFVTSGLKHRLLPDMVDMDATSLSIYMVKKVPEPFKNVFGETDYQDTWRIHYIDNQFEDWSGYVLKSLMYEYSIYIKNGYDCKGYKVQCDTLNYFKKRSVQPILKTPLFMGLDGIYANRLKRN
jgi:hypothetical protein